MEGEWNKKAIAAAAAAATGQRGRISRDASYV